jgi:ADP-heptose:LPS heptosyltransferase
MRILALVPGGISEQILFFPTLEDLKKRYPQATIDVIVEPSSKSAYRVCPHVSEVLTFDFKDRNGLADYLNLLGIIRDREYDIALDLGKRWTIGLLLWLNGIFVRVGYKTKTSWFFSKSVPLKNEQYVAYTYHDILQGLGIQSPTPDLKVTLPREDIDWAGSEQQRLGIKDSGYVLIYDGERQSQASDGSYPIEKWQKIVEDLQQKQPDLPIILLQAIGNRQWIAAMAGNNPDLKVTNPSDIGKLAAIVAGANLLLCPESVPMHLAVAVGTYAIALLTSVGASKFLPPNASDRCVGIQSPSDRIADIQPETILQQIWRS